MSDLSASLEPFLLVARSTKGAAAAKVIMDATSAPGVYGFGELLDMPNIKQSLAYSTLLPSLDEPSVRALEDLIIDSIYAGIISGRMDQINARFSVDWVLGRDLDVGGSGLRDLGMRLENWCEMTENLLSSLDIKIAQSRAETIATKALAVQQEQERFNAYHAFSLTGKAKGNKGDKQHRLQQAPVPQSGVTFNGPEASGSNSQPQAEASLGQGKQEQSVMAEIDPALLGTGRATRSQVRKPQTRNNAPGDAPANGAGSQQDNAEGTNDATEGTSNGATRIRLHSGASNTQASDAVKRPRRGV
ncbi:hypothetical protein QFC21_000773 [Naganishia friedmannii]|uniref:Uncharacterized protein n=1 Tax=Naganishia friedmannii TaxID=89922 RepID=A0ACC2W770_9TREE|nr:hypothetical protein QFC21_000773 [Naganishia friedmannii]